MTNTAEESKAKHIAAMGEELGSVYHALRQQVAWLSLKWSEYLVLFGTRESRVILLNRASPEFALMLQNTLFESVVLNITRLTDSPQMGKKENLSVQRLAELVSNPETKAAVGERVDEAISASRFCRDWRNRHIAHSDFHLALEQEAKPLEPASRQGIQQAVAALDAVLNVMSQHYLLGPIAFGKFNRGAESLLYVLDAGLHAEDARQERLRSRH
ncbi:MAG: hypothetical protein M3O15_01620 [Acidobacteriota bacterium]|nr:hypothetical protein [Acidobacteriota bacterium]